MDSWNTINNLVKFYYKIYKDDSLTLKNIKSKLLYILPIFICILSLLCVLEYALIRLAEFFVEVNLTYEYLTIMFLVIQVFQFVIGVSNISKNLFGSENEGLMKIPATGTEIFLSKIIYIYIHELLFSTIILLPYLFAFAIVFKMDALFYVMIIPTILFFPIMPFLLSLIFSIPIMFIRKLMKNKFLLLLLTSILTITIGYVCYIYALEYALKLVFFNTTHIDFTPELINDIIYITRYFYFERLLTNLLFTQNVGLSLAIIITASFTVLSLVTFFASKWYYTAFINEVNEQYILKKQKSKIVKGGPFIQLANKEFVNIFRSTNYSFQYLALAATIPIMVFFCTKLSLEIGTENIGRLITPGLVCMVIIMFSTLSSSFASSCITREGCNIYFVKLIPESITMQLNAKLLVYSLVGIISISLSCILILAFKFVDLEFGFTIWFATILICLSNLLNSVKRDLRNPTYKDLGNGEMTVSNNNTVLTIAIGIIVSLIFGGAVVALSYYTKPIYAIYAMLGGSLLYFVISIGCFYINLNKYIQRIEP